MASGKSTLGRALAERLGRQFVDLDRLIEERHGMPVPRIIAERGESAFRLLESTALKSTVKLKNVVVACGGGTPCFRDNMEFMSLHGLTLWLVASPERIVERLCSPDAAPRPLVAGKSGDELLDFVKSHLLQRQHFYNRAFWRIDSDSLESASDIDATVRDFLSLSGLMPQSN